MSTFEESRDGVEKSTTNQPSASRPIVRTRCATRCSSCRGRWRLHYGDELPNARIAFRLAGPEDAPVIAVLGGISAHRIVGGAEGWWPELVGPGHGIDTAQIPRARHRLSRRPRRELRAASRTAKFPPLSSYDQAEALRAHRRASRIEVAARHRRRLLRRHGGALLRRAPCGARRTHRGPERRRQVAGAVDRVAQRAAADRARSDRAGRRAVRA